MVSEHSSVTVISDGTFRLDGGLVFGQVPRLRWQELLRPDRQHRVTLGLNCALIRSSRGNILVDTGIGNKGRDSMKEGYAPSPSRLSRSLRERGLSLQDIDFVVLTHLHFDHAGGCTRLDRYARPVPAFPRACYVVRREAWAQAMQPNERARASFSPEELEPLERAHQLELLDSDAELVPGLFLRGTGGHTPGHQMVLLDQGGERVAFLGDLVPTSHNLPLPWIGAMDTYPEETLEQKRHWLGRAEREGWLVVLPHDPVHPTGYVERRNGRLALRPVRV